MQSDSKYVTMFIVIRLNFLLKSFVWPYFCYNFVKKWRKYENIYTYPFI